MIIKINPASTVPIYEQLREQIILGIAAGKLEPGEVLPSVRNLGADLGVNFHTVNKAYTMLCDEGYLFMNRRQGAVVAQTVPNNEIFMSQLSRRLVTAAAEAVCRGISKDDFTAICAECYNQSINGGEIP